MSTLGGIYNFNGAPIDERVIVSMGTALASRGPDGGSEFRSGSISMVYRAFHTNAESRLEIQPLISSNDQVLCWDGRLDNRAELIPMLRDEMFGDHTDAAIVLAAYQKWGTDFLARIIGDFALSLWDSQTKTLLLARDPAGPRPLFYHSNSDRIIWSSELSTLLDLAEIPFEVNDEFIAGFLTLHPDAGLTPYKDIHSVLPGSVVSVRSGHVQTRSYWTPLLQREICYKTDGEYEEHFRHLFREAVRCRLRADGPVWVMLSGGLDSSAIACIADEIIESGEITAPKLETVSFIYDKSPSADERDFLASVEEKRGRTGIHLLESNYPPFASFPDEANLSFPDILDCFVDRHRALCEAMQQDGARVVLTGHGGDEMLYSSPNPSPELQDFLLQRRVVRLHRSLRTWSRTLKQSYLKLLWRQCILPCLPQELQVFFLDPDRKLPPWYDENFIVRMKLRERMLPRFSSTSLIERPSGRDHAAGFLFSVKGLSRASYRARGCVEVSHPYLHRPLVEFLQAVPIEQKLRPGETRSLMRRSLSNLLPEKVLNRKGKKGPDEPLLRAIAREWFRLRSIFENAQVCARGYVQADALLAALERARHGCEKKHPALIQTIVLEFWLRALQNRTSAKSIAAFGEQSAPRATVYLPAEPTWHDTSASPDLL